MYVESLIARLERGSCPHPPVERSLFLRHVLIVKERILSPSLISSRIVCKCYDLRISSSNMEA